MECSDSKIRIIGIINSLDYTKLDKMLQILHTASDDSDKIDEKN